MRLKGFLAVTQIRQEDLGDRCRKLAKEMGLPQRGYSQSRLSKVVNNRIVPHEHEKKVIEKVLDATNLLEW